MKLKDTVEYLRLQEHSQKKTNWKNWGPYLSERAWGTVREDYSNNGQAWNYFPHDHTRSRAYRWNEDGLGGISDRNQHFCFAWALWNGKDPILKERMFGLTGTEGNHGEDVKDYYYYQDSSPTHTYMKMLYKYPQREFPYLQLVEENKRRGYKQLEYELIDTGIFDDNRYFDVSIEYAKASQEDILIRMTVYNRGPEPAQIHVLPTLWFRNTWGWGYKDGPMDDTPKKPIITKTAGPIGVSAAEASHPTAGTYYLYAEGAPEFWFTENETNRERIFNQPNPNPYVKDSFHRYLIKNETNAINPAGTGTKAAAHYEDTIPAGGHHIYRLRLSKMHQSLPFEDFDTIFKERKNETDDFYEAHSPKHLTDDEKLVQRQAFAGMLWSKQLYYFDVDQWMKSDGMHVQELPRSVIRNDKWEHLVNFDVISMPDKWEYPWYASWDLAFHAITLVLVDPDFAKRQLILMTREWYMHPNGQLPAYEWNFNDVNPPVLAWAAWRVYKIDALWSGTPDHDFLHGIFHKLLLNFTWWINRKDEEGRNVFQGGFLGLDNISVFDRSAPLPSGGHIDQSDGTAWMGFYCILMMKIALEISKTRPIYQDMATKFFEHFLRIAAAMVQKHNGRSLWDEEDGFFYDLLHLPDDSVISLKVRSLVGLLPLFAVETLEPELMDSMPVFARRRDWFISKRPDYTCTMACVYTEGMKARHLMSILDKDRLRRVLRYMLDENEFLSDYGIRSLSKYHQEHPYKINVGGREFCIDYQPAESQSGLFGGNSNWRGPIWFPINFLIIESLQKYHHYFGDDFKVECPTGSGIMKNLWEVAEDLSDRLMRIFLRNELGRRPVFGGQKKFQEDPYWRDNILFYEYFHGENGAGVGASHQTGWTGLVAKLIMQKGLMHSTSEEAKQLVKKADDMEYSSGTPKK